MNVKEVQAAGAPGPAGKKGKPEEPGGADFQKILQQAHFTRKAAEEMGSEKAGATGTKEIYPDPLLSISGVAFTTPASAASAAQRQGALAADRTLSLLERYQAFLADRNRPLGEIAPLLQSLSAQVKDLAESAEKISSTDPLQKIMTEVGVLSSVQIEKFNRGDYR